MKITKEQFIEELQNTGIEEQYFNDADAIVEVWMINGEIQLLGDHYTNEGDSIDQYIMERVRSNSEVKIIDTYTMDSFEEEN